jgi:hypothetical protein
VRGQRFLQVRRKPVKAALLGATLKSRSITKPV